MTRQVIVAHAFGIALGLTSCAAVTKSAERPCLTTRIPEERVKIGTYGEPEQVDFADSEGNVETGMQITVDPATMVKFFEYVESLEKVAREAKTCIRR